MKTTVGIFFGYSYYISLAKWFLTKWVSISVKVLDQAPLKVKKLCVDSKTYLMLYICNLGRQAV